MSVPATARAEWSMPDAADVGDVSARAVDIGGVSVQVDIDEERRQPAHRGVAGHPPGR
jgi:hypothetical protein